MWTAFLIFMAIPGSGALLVIVYRFSCELIERYREAKADTTRRDRIASEYMVPDWAVLEVPEPTGRRAVVKGEPPIDRYREVGR